MEGAENLLDYRSRPPGFVIIEASELGVVIRDPDVSLARMAISGWRLLPLAGMNVLLLSGLIFSGLPSPIRWALSVALGVAIFLGVVVIWIRWRTPSLVRIGNGRIFVRSRRGSKITEHDWDAREVRELETAHGSSTFHSLYSMRVHLQDGSKVPFLHCKDNKEGYWLLNYLKMLIANEQGALMVQEGLAPALEISLPPPPLPAMGARVAALEAQVVRTAPPGPPGSQSELTSNQNRA